MRGGTYYEFFAGGGMVRAGLGTDWECLLANDVSPTKGKIYTANWGSGCFNLGDINDLTLETVAGRADLAWASFPCQDLSIAGNGLGIGQESAKLKTRSGAFWAFMGLVRLLHEAKRAPTVIVLENVLGLLSANEGRDFVSAATAISLCGYRLGAIIVDACSFVPQSRPRVFIVAVRQDVYVPPFLLRDTPHLPWQTEALQRAYRQLPRAVARDWIWWSLGEPPARTVDFEHIVLERGPGIAWHQPEETRRLVSLMAAPHLKRIQQAKNLNRRQVGSLYLRMRPSSGMNVQRAEVNFAPVSGCIRTPKGGGSRPRIIVVEGDNVRTRLLSASEAARLMGLPEAYVLPALYEQAFQLIGDGVVVPAVSFIRDKLIAPLAMQTLHLAA